ncbi:glycoside hydrolase [Rheinheimera riviphila]|uniref:Glycoside hydrolase n=1 Tax=Rheinheimera riviphila TaxID=1834037 RepID=A0A437R0G8_9GAMM|nr:endo-beta-N-acetylglucosaminidase [Rheinheimera riviphila]RVU40230.1 glycoside hydrolase [Rheinheimera riviphila]
MRLRLLTLAISMLGFLPLVQAAAPVTAAPVTVAKVQIIPDQPPFALTLAQLKQWSPQSELASTANISHQPLARRFVAPLLMDSHQDQRAKVLYAPDGMNNFGNYLQPQPKFNLYNFSNWAQIDVLNWFAGTADLTVQIPARPWVDTAHKNGVKVIGSVFLGIAQWGGSPDTVEKLLEQDGHGRFVQAHQLVAIAQYYGFDGWLINQETDLTAVKDAQNQLVKGQKDTKRGAELAARMLAFMQYLTAIAPQGMEIHWYDSMLADGRVRWQNVLNEKNQQYLQQGKVASADAMFLNYWWNADMVQQSAAKADALGRSRYEVYFGADLWPSRDAQRAFSETKWLDWLFMPGSSPDKHTAYGSIALFAPNVNFNFSGESHQPAFSDFAADAKDHRRFYQTEQRLFAGDDLNSVVVDSSGWAGLSKYLPAKSVISSLPFVSSFNTGQGQHWFVDGQATGSGWTDISVQDLLPSWQFAVFGSAKVAVNYDFDQAWQGGSSLLIETTTAGDADIPLYQTQLRLGTNTQLRLVFQPKTGTAQSTLHQVQLYLQFADGHRELFPLTGSAIGDGPWQQLQVALPKLAGRELARIGLQWPARPQTAAVPPSFRLGQLELLP